MFTNAPTRSHNYYKPVDQDEEGIISRYRVIASGPFPAKVDCTWDDSNSNTVLDACIVGGVLWKLQQFCRLQQKGANFWRTHGVLLGIYVLLILGLGMVLEGKPPPQDDNAEGESVVEPEENSSQWKVGVGLVVITVLYFLVLVLLGAGLWISQTFRTKLDDCIQEISEQLEPLGLKLAQDTRGSWLFRTRHIPISLQKRTSAPIHILPAVTDDFFRDHQPPKETRATVESILYYGGHSPSLSNTPLPRYPLPVDDWIAGGIMMRLRKERHRAALCSRCLAFLVLFPIAVLTFLHLASGSNHEEEDQQQQHDDEIMSATNPYHVLAFCLIGISLVLIYLYVREFLDGSAVHAVSRSALKQFSGLAKERHDITLLYEVQPGNCLPRTTQGVVRFQPETMVTPSKRKVKATLAFV